MRQTVKSRDERDWARQGTLHSGIRARLGETGDATFRDKSETGRDRTLHSGIRVRLGETGCLHSGMHNWQLHTPLTSVRDKTAAMYELMNLR